MPLPIILAAWVTLSVLIGLIGRNFRFRFWGYFFASLLLTPIIGLLLLIAAIPVDHVAEYERAQRRR